MNKHKTIGCTKFDCCQYDADPATCDDNDCPQRCDEPKGFKKWINKVIKNNIFSKLLSFLFNKKKNTPHCGHPPSDGIGCGCAFALFFFWFWLPAIMFVLKLGGGKKKKSQNMVKINSTEKKPRVAFISVYNTPCGISTYNEQLIQELKQYADVKVFAEYADDVKSEKIEGDDEFVIRCWHRRDAPKIRRRTARRRACRRRGMKPRPAASRQRTHAPIVKATACAAARQAELTLTTGCHPWKTAPTWNPTSSNARTAASSDR